jgi:hypothetical protein
MTHRKVIEMSLELMLKGIFIFFIFIILITLTWQFYEIKVFGELRPDIFHTIVALILAVSLTLNVIIVEVIKKQ